MIYCRDLNLIFIKTKKVGGTSFEIALSKYCDDNDIITRISPEDENIREGLGFQGPVNYESLNRSEELTNLGITGDFRNHNTAEEIYQNLGYEIFSKSIKITIQRDPIDFIVSLYWFQKTGKNKKFNSLSLREWLEVQYHTVEDNYKIAPIVGPKAPDIILNYSTLVNDIKNVSELPSDFLKVFQSLRVKGNRRPLGTEDPISFLKANDCDDFIPKIIDLYKSAKLLQ